MNYRKNYTILIGIFGTVFEWLEYSYYGYLTTKISALFFPQFDHRAAMLATMGIFAAGFLMRPVGSIIFGYIGDRKGRKTALFISLFLMGIATLMMGALPTYESIGIYASLLLLFCRLMQGLAVSGEFNGASIFLIEHCKNNYPNLAGSWIATAAALGMLLGASSAMIVTQADMPTWAWRVPFFFAFACCFIANYLRYRLAESPVFIQASHHKQIVKFPLFEVFKKHKIAFCKNILLGALVSVYIYICNVYFVNYLIKDIHLTVPTAISLAGVGELAVVLCTPFAALLADYFGEKIVMLSGLFLALIAAPLLFKVATSESIFLISLGQILYGISNAFAFGPIFNFIYKLFPTAIRYTGNSVAWSIGVALFGSTSPIVADYLLQHHSVYGPALYVSLFILFAVLIVLKKVFAEFNLKNNGMLKSSL